MLLTRSLPCLLATAFALAGCGSSESASQGADAANGDGSSGSAGAGRGGTSGTAGEGGSADTDASGHELDSGSGGAAAGGGGGGNGGAGAADGGAGAAGGGAAGDASSATELIIPDCPGPTEHCDSERCLPGEPCVQCGVGEVCVEVNISCGPASGISAQCVDDPCAGAVLDCSCASAVCDGAPDMFAFDLTCGVYTQDHFLVGPGRDPFMSCSGGGICASPDTAIATPNGERPIADLQPGDLVYSRDRNQTVIVPVLTVTRRPVRDHRVVRLELSDGAILEISGPHPTGDRRRLDELSTGDELDGRRVLSTKLVHYGYSHTYDVLPASESGDYVANGVWMGTTLRRRALVAGE